MTAAKFLNIRPIAVRDRLRILVPLAGKSETHRPSAWPSHLGWCPFLKVLSDRIAETCRAGAWLSDTVAIHEITGTTNTN